MSFYESFRQAVRVFISDVGDGFFLITHSGLALLGLGVFCAMVLFGTQPDLRSAAEVELIDWLQTRHDIEISFDNNADAVDRATAADPRDLPKDQANIAMWLSRKYHVAPEPISALVAEAFEIGPRNRLDPTLILAVMAIESSFNPFAQSTVGAQGLMQVRTKVHTDKYEDFGGDLAAFDPIANLRVGVEVLKESIARNGSVEAGLRQYVGAANSGEDGGYTAKVLAEQHRLQEVALGHLVPVMTAKPADSDKQGLQKLWDKAKQLATFDNQPSE
ncbi:MAG: lytic transglycosylase domain-containing protein [Betaproteobacteria bacterium]|nr:lytic transglycosylase domain-containing protein [Betaproteobacteria bacterium]